MADRLSAYDAFLIAATVPVHGWHADGMLDEAESILSPHPELRHHDIYTASVLGNEEGIREFLLTDPALTKAKGGPHGWDALTYLCFSRYLRLQKLRSSEFVRAAAVLLEAGADANTGFMGEWAGKDEWESVIYGAAGLAHDAALTKLLLDYGADPNDGETTYHAAETYDNAAVKALLDSGKLNEECKVTLLVRKADWHDAEGMRLVLEHGADPNWMPMWGSTAFQHALRRDNGIGMIEMLLDHGADPAVVSKKEGDTGFEIAARRGRGDVLALLQARGYTLQFAGVNRLIAACALGHQTEITRIVKEEPGLREELIAQGGKLLAEFAGNGNVQGVNCLLDTGVEPDALFKGDPYWDEAAESTALHVAAWRARPAVVKELIRRGTRVNAVDGRGRTALQLAIKACVDSHRKERRTPESIADLLAAGASQDGISFPTGYPEADALLAVSR